MFRKLFYYQQEVTAMKTKIVRLRERNEALVFNILPSHVATHLIGKHNDNVGITIVQTDFIAHVGGGGHISFAAQLIQPIGWYTMLNIYLQYCRENGNAFLWSKHYSREKQNVYFNVDLYPLYIFDTKQQQKKREHVCFVLTQ